MGQLSTGRRPSGAGTLAAALTGPVIVPGDRDYDLARRVWNADIDRRPAVIARCADPADVAAAIRFATAHGLEIAVRGGAHSMSGASTVDGGLVIDLSLQRQVTVDPAARRARAGGGALLGGLDAATQAYGLAVPTGLVSHTGVGGLTLGGGMGWLTRQAGLSIDNLVSAEVVTADGRVLRATAEEHADLFWAIRGGGGNFGVVTRFEFRLHPVGPAVRFAFLFWAEEHGPEVLRLCRELFPTLPREINILIAALNAPPAPFVPEQHRFRPGYALLVAGFGTAAQHDRVLAHIRSAVPPRFEFVDRMPYVRLQQLLDEANAWGFHCYEKSCYLEDLSDGAIDVLTEHLARRTSPLSFVPFYRLDEAFSEPGENDTAFGGGRSPRYVVFIVGACPAAGQLAAERAWVRALWEALRPYATGAGTYVNAMAEYEPDRVLASYGPATYARLASVKRRYDPGNVFRRNVNIEPA
jgi:FAD/FMN-containing dehydrogenase